MLDRLCALGEQAGAKMGYQQQQRPVVDWGAAPTTAPSTKRVDALGWLLASVALGTVSGCAALAATWRPMLGLDAPPGELAAHAGHALRWAIHCAMPHWFALDAQVYESALSKLSRSQRTALMWRGAIGAISAIAPGALLAKTAWTPRDGLIPLRGAKRFEGDAAAKALRWKLAGRAKRLPDHPMAPGIPYPSDLWTRHVLLVAGTGAGKSTVLRPLIANVIRARESLLLFDPKGEFTKAFPEPAIMAPWDARSLGWDIAKDLRNVGDMRRFAGAMIREAQDPMWSNAARQLLVGFLIYLKSTRGVDWGWRELAEMMAMPQASVLSIMSAHHPEAVRAVERASVTTQGILINLASFAAPIFDLAEAWGDAPDSRRISFVEWTHGRSARKQIILQGHGAYPDLTKGYLEGLFGVVSAIVNSVEIDDDPSRKLWIIADEAPQMGKVPIRPLLDVGRSRGVRCVLACQDLAQLEEIHGQHTAKAMASMVGTLLVGQIMQGDTAEQLCKAMGTIEVERANVSSSLGGGGGTGKSTTLSFSRDELAVYKASELGSRLGPTPDGKGVKMALFTGGCAYELFWPHFPMPSRRPAHKPAAWTLRFGPNDDARRLIQGGVLGSPQPGTRRAPSGAQSETAAGAGAGSKEPGDQIGDAGADRPTRDASRAPTAQTKPASMPTTEEIENLLRQEVEVTSRDTPQAPVVRLDECDELRTSNQLISRRARDDGSPTPEHAAGHGWVAAGSGAIPYGSRESEAVAALSHVLGNTAASAAAHASVGEAGALLVHAAEALDMVRKKPGPIETVSSVQRRPPGRPECAGGPSRQPRE